MPPKKDTTSNPATIEDLAKLMTAQYNGISNRLDNFSNRFDSLEAKMEELSEENAELKEAVKERETTISNLSKTVSDLEARLNKMDQYNRSWSVRILNVSLTDNEASNAAAVKQRAYEVFLPILEGAVRDGALPVVPSADQLLEVAHILPGKSGQAKPIICRFCNRNTRSTCFRLKKDYAARTPPASASRAGATSEGRYLYPFYEDLSAANFGLLCDLNGDSRVKVAWSMNGQIRFRLTNSEDVKKVPFGVLDIDSILK